MAKQQVAKIKLQIPAGQANPAPPVGPALGEHKVNIMDFCKKFNEATKGEEPGLIIPVEITVYTDRSFDLTLKQPPVAVLLRKAAGVDKGSPTAKRLRVGRVSMEQVRRIAERKLPDLNTDDLAAAIRMVVGTAENMGLEVVP
ncbi:MAG: 50S ribosomal protein L11 [Candidatus Bipolaricaulis anaerobius]|uniref:Large ribosomal subunit protein uL11 n=1 Tax=Candidatus Bipolaricaulis anaerobius TaxID=2026885 RepID=A0A2X3KX25_9BACT|nr:50S ribosomal protein L11 [Candidatus Bipolaricaulis anaerobius]MBP7725760.1 50S ribosomal protein L11 [Candidatus Bipolaricaulis sp.]MDD2911915.1 50S ribosomal protein L11 [Candidatus Bipolaricaulis anaerobius]MDD3747992.1 50S ribosomal protein L11 [Candidatus Bipolaricaulis anaerobius]MDD5763749.1 50S ribosomal protein L11 [Candidatus Bipolaricaulis anaerobius]SQD93138.1 50S ribosomal subunit protein L11 [Candidatus Bipolaricaulis anaerobius]